MNLSRVWSGVLFWVAAAAICSSQSVAAQAPKVARGRDEDETRRRGGRTDRYALRGDLEGWNGWPIFTWLHNRGQPDAEILRTLAQQNLGGSSVDAEWSSATQALLDTDFYVTHLAGDGALRLDPIEFLRDQSRCFAEPEKTFPVRPMVLADPALKTRLVALVKEHARAHKISNPLAYSLGDEISITRGVDPLDYSFDELTLASLKQWLIKRYHDLDGLNETWRTEFRALEHVRPDTTHQIRRKNTAVALEDVNFASWNDHRAFMDVQFAAVLKDLSDAVETVDRSAPVGFLGGQAPAAFGGFDWWQLTKSGTFFEAYDHGLAPEIVHAFKSKDSKLVSSVFVPEGTRLGEDVIVNLWRKLTRGDDGIILSPAENLVDADGQLSPVARGLSRELSTFRRAHSLVSDLPPAKPEILIYLSQPSIRAGWMLDSWLDGSEWLRRDTAYEYEHSCSIRTREAWGELLREMSLPFSFLDARELAARGGVKLDAKVIILNEALALSDIEVHELLRFVASGGLLIGDAHAAVFDEHLRGRNSKALRALFGMNRRKTQMFADLASWHNGQRAREDTGRLFGLRRGEQWMKLVEGESEQQDLGTLRRIGDGHAVYLNLDLRDYTRLSREQPQFAEDLRTRFAEVLRRRGDVMLFPRLEYDNTCRRLRLIRFGTAASGSFLLFPNQAPFATTDATIYFDNLKNVHDQGDGIEIGIRNRIDMSIGRGQYKWVRFERHKSRRPRDMDAADDGQAGAEKNSAVKQKPPAKKKSSPRKKKKRGG